MYIIQSILLPIKNNKEHVICQYHSMQSKVPPRNGCDSRLKIRILITTIHVNCYLVHASLNSPELSLFKSLLLTYHQSHFLAATLDFTSFHHSILGSCMIFLQLGCFDTTMSDLY